MNQNIKKIFNCNTKSLDVEACQDTTKFIKPICLPSGFFTFEVEILKDQFQTLIFRYWQLYIGRISH